MKLFIISLIIFFSLLAQAGLYIEPYLGYDSATSQGDVNQTAPATQVIPVNTEDTGLRYGTRFGLTSGEWAYGLDILTGELTDRSDSKSTHTDIGVFASYRHNKKYVFNLGYVASSAIKVVDSLELKGSGFRFGVGFIVHPRVHFTLDYLMTTYTEVNISGAEATADLTKGSAVLGISFPFGRK